MLTFKVDNLSSVLEIQANKTLYAAIWTKEQDESYELSASCRNYGGKTVL